MTDHHSPAHTRTLVMAVPFVTQRAKRAIRLNQDPEVHAEIIWDRKQDAFVTWLDMLEAAGDSPVILMQDDVYTAPRWRERVEAAISERPDDVIQFFSLRKDDAELGSRYMAPSTYLMNQCFYLPDHDAASLLAFSREWYVRRTQGEVPTGLDTCMKRWLMEQSRRYWLHVPSLVQHEPWESEIGLAKTGRDRSRARQSPTFEEEDA